MIFTRELYLNICVQDLKRSKEFFRSLNLSFHPQFSNEHGACLILSPSLYVMLLTPSFFESFILGKSIVNAHTQTESIIGLSACSREEVDTLVEKAILAGAKPFGDLSDQGWMYSRAFEDLDGHIWEVLFMDTTSIPTETGSKAS